MRPRIAARDGGDVEQLPRGRLVEARALEPAEERAAGAAGERLAARRLDLARRLTDEHRPRRARVRDDRQNRPTRGRTAGTRRAARSARRARSRAHVASGERGKASRSLPLHRLGVPRVLEAVRRPDDPAVGDERGHELGRSDVEGRVVDGDLVRRDVGREAARQLVGGAVLDAGSRRRSACRGPRCSMARRRRTGRRDAARRGRADRCRSCSRRRHWRRCGPRRRSRDRRGLRA